MKFLPKTLMGLLVTQFASADTLNPIIVSSKNDSNLMNLAHSTSTIESTEVNNSQDLTFTNLIKEIPSIQVAQTGIIGGQTSLFLRGADSDEVMLMIDGVHLFDPTSPNRAIDLSLLDLLDIEKIEILKGTHGVLYGTNAIAGVINIITKKTSANKVHFSGGNLNGLGLSGSYSNSYGGIFSAISYQESRIDSAAYDGDEKDRFQSKNLTLSSAFELGNYELESLVKVADTYTDIDDGNPVVDRENAYAKRIYQVYRHKTKYHFDNSLSLSLDLKHTKNDYKSKYYSTYSSSFSYLLNDGETNQVETLINKKVKHLNAQVVLGNLHLKEDINLSNGKSVKSEQNDIFALWNQDIGTYSYELGLRHIKQDNDEDKSIYSLGFAKRFGLNHKVFTSYKTGLNTPSVNQLYGQYGANEDLKAEEIETYEIGFLQKSMKLENELTLFYTEVDNQIEYGSKYENVNKAIRKGLELNSKYTSDSFSVNLGLTLIHFDLSTGKEVVRRPSESLKLGLHKNVTKNHSFGINWRYAGKRFNKSQEIMKAYDVTDFMYYYKQKNLNSSFGIINLFDRKYEEAAGYAIIPLSLQAKLTYIF